KFKAKYDLPFPLLSDPDHAVAAAYGAWGEKKMYGKTYEGIVRSHFGVDEEGRLTEIAIQVKPETTADLALRLIQL
ncbi:MAG: redoxin domain-containing protein, partial [Anaerolineae bacterium]|nr:redoxin domain-containing protein [Anaerolineae bacterium]